ncbi:2-hydroxycarboxylate transporter family protein [Pseudodesulfovibrio methanolicus]|uniref:2-hydroxycarboxylate transporter family protein n=1 Tax=Pseudodesulfovibrio methanolicus TaxID=3126690 RepID=A0ABZ2IVG3_9BACT
MNTEVMGMKLPHLLALSVLVAIASAIGKLPGGMVGGFAITMSMGFLLDWLGSKTPIVNSYLGGGPIFCIFVSAAFVYFGIMPPSVKKVIDGFMKPSDFLNFYIAALICGSIFGMKAKLLVKAGLRFAVPIVLGLICASILAGLVGALTGEGWSRGIAFICYPIMGGGLGAGVLPMSEILHASTNISTKEILSLLIPPMAIGNVLAIIFGGLLDKLGKVYPQLSGEGKLIRSGEEEHEVADVTQVTIQALGIGLFTACTMLLVGRILSKFIPLHYYALMIITVAILKVSGVVPKSIQEASATWFKFVAKYMTAPLLVGVGVTYTDLGVVIDAFNLQTFFLVLSVIVGAIIGAGCGGLLVGFHFIESAIAAGLCMANMGGTGDVAVLSAANRFELMPFSQIASRLGGALILIIVGLTIPILY